jgi:DNA-binding transcriptional LysR family regulator
MVEKLQAFMVVLEEHSVNRAAARLRMAQPALSRQIKVLEHEVGGLLFERRTSGMVPTALGHALAKSMGPVLHSYETALAQVRREARGQRSELRIGYLISASKPLLTPALESLRKAKPALQLKLFDLSPREQIEGLRAGDLDLALIGQEGAGAVQDFHSRKLCSVGVCAALAQSDPLAKKRRLALADLRDHPFIGIDEREMPGRNRWMTKLCRTAGFRPRFEHVIDGITHVLALVASESAVTLVPSYLNDFPHPDVKMIPLTDAHARWEFLLLWQRGKVSEGARALIDALTVSAARISP